MCADLNFLCVDFDLNFSPANVRILFDFQIMATCGRAAKHVKPHYSFPILPPPHTLTHTNPYFHLICVDFFVFSATCWSTVIVLVIYQYHKISIFKCFMNILHILCFPFLPLIVGANFGFDVPPANQVDGCAGKVAKNVTKCGLWQNIFVYNYSFRPFERANYSNLLRLAKDHTLKYFCNLPPVSCFQDTLALCDISGTKPSLCVMYSIFAVSGTKPSLSLMYSILAVGTTLPPPPSSLQLHK